MIRNAKRKVDEQLLKLQTRLHVSRQ